MYASGNVGWAAWLICLGIYFSSAATAPCGTIEYSGRVWYGADFPSRNSLVVIGAFTPEFDPDTYGRAYGDDVGNLLSNAFDLAVADGTFTPFATTLTDSTGLFSGTTEVEHAPGEPIWLFAFDQSHPDSIFQVLASSSSPGWLTPEPEETTTLHAFQANRFVFGGPYRDGVVLRGVPIPEPAILGQTLLAIGFAVQLMRCRCGRMCKA